MPMNPHARRQVLAALTDEQREQLIEYATAIREDTPTPPNLDRHEYSTDWWEFYPLLIEAAIQLEQETREASRERRV